MEFGVVVAWLVAVLVLSLLALPLTAWLFPRDHHGAYAFTLAIVVVGVVAHLVGHLTYRFVALAAGVLVLVVLSTIALPHTSIDRRGTLEATAVFVLAFLFIVALRAIEPSAGTNPHWVGEMFLDFGLLNSLEQAGSLPPEDMWFAGESVRYHYGGHLLTSLLAGLSATPPALAYNLGLATFFALLATMAWGVAGSIASRLPISTRWAAGLGVFFVGFAANLETAVRVLVWLLPRQIGELAIDLAGVDSDVIEWGPGDFFYYDASRVITRQVTAATEFPLFSWLHGDLHGHVLVKPLLLLVVAFGVAYWFTPPSNRRRRGLLLFGATPPLLGLISVVNMWSLPVVTGLVAVFFTFAPGHPADLLRPGTSTTIEAALESNLAGETRGHELARGVVSETVRVFTAVLYAGIVLLLAILWSAPYWWIVVIGGPGESLATWETGTPLGQFLLVQGAFIAAISIYLGARLIRGSDRAGGVAGGVAVLVLLLAIVGWAVAGIVLALLGIAWWFLRLDRSDWSTPDDTDPEATQSIGPEVMLLVAGLGILLIVEVAKLQGDSFNSIFKPYADVWQLLAIGLAVIAVRLVDGWPLTSPDRNRSRWAAVSLVFVILLVLSTGLYGMLAIPAHVENGNSWSDATSQVQDAHGYTLDARAHVEVLYPDEAPAIEWLADIDGQPTIVTSVPSGYFWQPDRGEGAAAPASLTGASTVLGWEHHERQYRGTEAYETRLQDVIDIYVGEPEEQRALLEQYAVDYVYVGPAERATWPWITIDELDSVDVAVEFEQVTIYEVDLDE